MATFFSMPGNERLTTDLAKLVSGETGLMEMRRFPDGETYVRVTSDVNGRDVFVVCTLARPDPQFLGLVYAARQIRALGASRIGLIAPYLAYMRQDRIFHPGEALTSRMFAELLQQHFDELITIDPHLHRHASLEELYDMPVTLLHAGELFVEWVRAHVEKPLLIGEDGEAEQWVRSMAVSLDAPWVVLTKERRGARDVRIDAPDMTEFQDRTPVVVDDIVSSGGTMLKALRVLRRRGFAAPHCLVVHVLGTPRTLKRIENNCARLMSSNSVPNASACFDIAPLIADALVAAASEPLSLGRHSTRLTSFVA